MNKTELFGIECEIEYFNNDKYKSIYWVDGCYRLFYENGHEKEAKVIISKTLSNDKKQHWHYCYRNDNGNIIKEIIK